MTIETKYNIGDEVWVQTLTNGVQKWKIQGINIEITENGKYRELYRIEVGGYYYIAYLCELSPLKKNY